MILLLDNYDSFTYNLYQFIAGVESEISGIQKDQIDSKVKVIRNDQITPEKDSGTCTGGACNLTGARKTF